MSITDEYRPEYTDGTFTSEAEWDRIAERQPIPCHCDTPCATRWFGMESGEHDFVCVNADGREHCAHCRESGALECCDYCAAACRAAEARALGTAMHAAIERWMVGRFLTHGGGGE